MRWYQIDAAGMPGVALAQTLSGQETAAQRAMGGDCLLRVLRAAWIKAAMLPQQRADSQLVRTEHHQQQRFHREVARSDCRTLSSSSFSSDARARLSAEDAATCPRATT